LVFIFIFGVSFVFYFFFVFLKGLRVFFVEVLGLGVFVGLLV